MRRFVETMSVFALFGVGVAPALAAPTDKAEKDVLAALDSLKEGTMKKDRATLDKVMHADLSYGHSNGLVETKAQAVAHIVENPGSYDAINFSDTKVRVHGNTALVTGKVEMHQKTKEGNATQANLVALTVWLKGPKGWQLVARQATRPPPPGQPAAAAAAPPAAAKPHH